VTGFLKKLWYSFAVKKEWCHIHELPLTQKILDIALKYGEKNQSEKIITVCIRVGDLRDFVEEITQRYWDYLSIGTIAYGAKIKFERVPVSAICNNCENIFYFDWHDEDKPCCTKCGNFDNRLITGMELEVKEISIL